MPKPKRKPSAMSYLAKIADAKEASPLAAFAAFPADVKFEGQDRGERIVLLIRRHPVVLVPSCALSLILIVAPLLLIPVLGVSGIEISLGYVSFGVGVAILWAMLIVSFTAFTFFKWFYSVNVVTDERIVDIDFEKLFYHKISETQLERVEDVSHSPVGIWAAMFDYGTVYIQTAAEQREFEFNDVPRPRDVQDTILDLLEQKQTQNG